MENFCLWIGVFYIKTAKIGLLTITTQIFKTEDFAASQQFQNINCVKRLNFLILSIMISFILNTCCAIIRLSLIINKIHKWHPCKAQ